MPIADFADFMPETVTHAEFSSRDSYGVKSYGSPVSYSARVVYKPTMVRTRDGMETVAKGVVWLQGSPSVDPDDQITLPDNSTPPILATERVSDRSGFHHTKIFFG